MRAIIGAFAKNRVFANILFVLIMAGGGIALTQMTRETFPEIHLDRIIITVVWPGADPSEIDEGIGRKLEEVIEHISGVKEYLIHASENASTSMITVAEGFDVEDVKDRVENAVNAITTFPADVERPIVEKLVLQLHVMFIALSGDGLTQRELKEWADRVRIDLQSHPEVSNVEILGDGAYEIAIELSEEQLQKYGLSFQQVAGMVAASSQNVPGGSLKTEEEELRLRTMGRRYTAEEFAGIVVLSRPTGERVTLGKIATIREQFDEKALIARLNGAPAISMRILKTPAQDTIKIDQVVKEFVAQQNTTLPDELSLTVWGETASILTNRINLLLRNGLTGLFVVFISLWLFLDIRLSFWAGMGIPISLAGAFMVMWAWGASINMMTLFAMIMVLGIIVDDAIVVGEAIYYHRKAGKSKLRAAIDGTHEVALPVVAAVLTTIVAFLPLAFTGGWMGKLIFALPLVTISALAVSLLECLILLPAHLNDLPDPNAEKTAHTAIGRFGIRFHKTTNGGLEWFASHVYRPFLSAVLSWRYLSLGVVFFFVMVTAGLLQSGIIKLEFIEPPDGNSISATVEFADGTPRRVVAEGVAQMEAAFLRLAERLETRSGGKLLNNRYTVVGESLGLPGDKQRGPNAGSVLVELLDSTDRGILLKDIIPQWEKEAGFIPGATGFSYTLMDGELPGAPIEVWLLGNSLETLVPAAEALAEKLDEYAGVYQVKHTYQPGKNELRLALRPEGQALGLTSADLGRQINAGYYGAEAIRVQRGKDNILVKVQYPESERDQIADFEEIRIRTPLGFEVPLATVAEVTVEPGYSTITRVDGRRQISIASEINSKLGNANDVVNDLTANFLPGLLAKYPGVEYEFQGDAKNLEETFGALAIGGPLAILGIYVIIATIFGSYLQPIVILFTVPLGTIGAAYGHLLLGFNMSMMSVFGIVALAGVVVNDAIVLIERINGYLAEGMPFIKAVLNGGERRFRAIFLTTLSTVGGLSPIILETDFHARLLIPMAISIAAGVTFATLLTLIYIPCLLCILNDARRLMNRIQTGNWPTREAVEPARLRRIHDDELASEAAGVRAVSAEEEKAND